MKWYVFDENGFLGGPFVYAFEAAIAADVYSKVNEGLAHPHLQVLQLCEEECAELRAGVFA